MRKEPHLIKNILIQTKSYKLPFYGRRVQQGVEQSKTSKQSSTDRRGVIHTKQFDGIDKELTKIIEKQRDGKHIVDYSFLLFNICGEKIFEKLRSIYQNFSIHDRFVMMLELIRIELGEAQLTKIKGEFLQVARQKVKSHQKQIQINERISKVDVHFNPGNKNKRIAIKALKKYCTAFQIFVFDGKEKAILHLKQKKNQKIYQFNKVLKTANQFQMKDKILSTLEQDLQKKTKERVLKHKLNWQKKKQIWKFGCIQLKKGSSLYQFEIKIVVKETMSKMVNELQNFTKIEQELLNLKNGIEVNLLKQTIDQKKYSEQQEMIKQEDNAKEYISLFIRFEEDKKMKNLKYKDECSCFEEHSEDYLTHFKSPEIQSELKYVLQFIVLSTREENKIYNSLRIFASFASWITSWAQSEESLVSPFYFSKSDERSGIIAKFIELEMMMGKKWLMQKESSFRKFVQSKKKGIQIMIEANSTSDPSLDSSHKIFNKKYLLKKVPSLIEAYSNFIKQKSNCLMALKCLCWSQLSFRFAFQRLKIVIPEVKIRNFIKKLSTKLSQEQIADEIHLNITYEQQLDHFGMNIDEDFKPNEKISKKIEEIFESI